MLGVATGLVVVWVASATALLIPGQPALRREVQRSEFVRRLNEVVPPRQLLDLLARIDPFQTIVGAAAPAEPASPVIARAPGVVKAEASVVKVIGTACGIGIEGSGWFATISMVVTNAHVVAGEHDTKVEIPGYRIPFDAFVVAFDSRNDVAVLRVLGAVPQVPLRSDRSQSRYAGCDRRLPAERPAPRDAGADRQHLDGTDPRVYGHGPLPRTITAVAGRIRHGNSGGPAVDCEDSYTRRSCGALGGPAATPSRPDREAGARRVAQEPVSTGDCAAG